MKRNNLCAEIGYMSVNHDGEQLCGDHVDVVESDDSTIIVLADGLGSGVKASMVEMIFEVRVERMLALTPLPRPSASTMTLELSSPPRTSRWSPQSCSP